ncbi:MAG TPA: EamA family transporter [Solirubrobacteraceae bacterium]|nr:EamA family transporter [Solirubrobacteraceae bacterium]
MAVPDRAPAEAVGPLDRVPPVALLLTGATSVQFGAALAATLFDDIGPEGASMLRLVLSAAVLVVAWRPAVRGRSRADLRLVAAFGLALGLMNFAFYEALDRIPLGVAVTIEFAGPVGVAVALSRRRLDLLWVALAVAGIVLLADPFGAGGIDPVGLAFVLTAAASWAAYILLAQRTAGRFRGGEGLALASVVAALVPLGPGLAVAGGDLLDWRILLLGACVALLSSVIPYSLETEALRRMPANVFGVLMSLEPVVAAIAGLVVLGQHLGRTDLAAMALVVAASIGVTRTARGGVAVEA